MIAVWIILAIAISLLVGFAFGFYFALKDLV